MKALVQEKAAAIELRRRGYSYREILSVLPVAKSSLSLWLKDLPLTVSEKTILKKRKNANISHGRIKAASELRKRRLDREKTWLQEAREVFDKNKHDPFFHIGVSLYWAEGAKRVTQWSFMNSDEEMIRIMIKWLGVYASVIPSDLFFRLYIHKPYAHENCELWWQQELVAAPEQFTKTIYKPSSLNVKKRPNYKGCMKIELRKSKHLLCKMKFWQRMQVVYLNQDIVDLRTRLRS